MQDHRLDDLAAVLADLRPLIAAFGKPVAIRAARSALDTDQLQRMLAAMFRALDLAEPVVRAADDDRLSLIECVVNDRLHDVLDAMAGNLVGHAVGDLAAYMTRYLAEVYYEGIAIETLRSLDGTSLTTYRSTGHRQSVLMVLPCGSPFQMARGWVAFLRRSFNVITWESRAVIDRPGDLPATPQTYLDMQSDDLQAVLDHYCPEPPHVMGICGGAIVALNAARQSKLRLAGLSLWYGDYNFNDPQLQTDYQRNLLWMLEMAASGDDSARMVYDLFHNKAMLKSLNKRHAATILQPYADVTSLQRYARLNGAIMSADVARLAAALPMVVSVVSGESDHIAHPGGSRKLATLLAHCRLYMEPDGDHLAFFEARERTREIALECIRSSFT